MEQQQKSIGIFDSGLGGLTVAKAIEDLLPNESIIYFGDTLHMPYGNKSEGELKEYTTGIVDFLLKQNVKMIVIACNSASAQCASYLRKKFHTQCEIQGVIRPIVQHVINEQYKRIGIIGTEATIKSNIYQAIINEYKPTDVLLQTKATPLLAPMIEQSSKPFDDKVLAEYLAEFDSIDTLLLACTHYPLIKSKIDEYFNYKLAIHDNSSFMAAAVESFLKDKNLLNSSKQDSVKKYFVSQYSNSFEEKASLFYGKTINVQEENIFA